MNRDSIGWWIGLLTGLVGVVAAQADAFGPTMKTYITLAGALLAVVSGYLKASPLPAAPKP